MWINLPLSCSPIKKLEVIREKADALADGDEYSLVPIRYRSRLNFCPELHHDFYDVLDTMDELAKLTPEQIDSIDSLSRAFDLNFQGIKHFIFYLETLKYWSGRGA